MSRSDGPVAGLDPGRGKCGLVLSDPECRRIVIAAVEPPDQAEQTLAGWREQGLRRLIVGDGTGSAAWRRQPTGPLQLDLVDERGTTLAARRRYWQLEPPRGWRRLLPEGLRVPPRDIDDVVAQLLVERWLGRPLQRDVRTVLRMRPAR